MYKKAKKEARILEEFKAYSVVWVCEKGHKNFQTIIGKEGTQHDICLKCGEHYEYIIEKEIKPLNGEFTKILNYLFKKKVGNKPSKKRF
jgi:hypothetical protein